LLLVFSVFPSLYYFFFVFLSFNFYQIKKINKNTNLYNEINYFEIEKTQCGQNKHKFLLPIIIIIIILALYLANILYRAFKFAILYDVSPYDLCFFLFICVFVCCYMIANNLFYFYLFIYTGGYLGDFSIDVVHLLLFNNPKTEGKNNQIAVFIRYDFIRYLFVIILFQDNILGL